MINENYGEDKILYKIIGILPEVMMYFYNLNSKYID